jgi:nucleotide-binding universal stress UspA family protein
LGLPHLQTRIRIGSADEEITQEAREGECDLVVIGQARAPRVVESFRGSLSERLARRLHCSLLILRAPAHPIERILLCDSGADNSKTVRRFAARLSELLPSEVQVTVLHVMSQITAGPGVRGEQLRAGAEKLILEHSPEGELLEGDVQVLGKLDLHPSPKVRHGLVVDEILSEACSGGYDLVIIGSHQNAGWQRFLLDDLAQKIIDGLDRSVLVVK